MLLRSSVIEGTTMDQPSSVSTEDVSHATELTERQLLLKAHEISCETLRLFCTHYNGRLPLEGLGGARISILIATAVKAINTSHAVCRLCAERPYFEEMNVVTRSLIESIVNGVYIQFATDEEVQSFTHFDSISLAKAIRIAEGIAPEAVGVLSEKLRQEFSVHTDSVKAMLGKTEQDFSWTRLDIVSKGDRIDKGLGVPAFAVVCKVLFPSGHAYVHGSYRSLEAYMPTEGGKVLLQHLDFQADGALHHMNVALLALCIAMNQLSTERLDDWIAVIQRVLTAYSQRMSASARKDYASRGF
jgi:hypothetical protein